MLKSITWIQGKDVQVRKKGKHEKYRFDEFGVEQIQVSSKRVRI